VPGCYASDHCTFSSGRRLAAFQGGPRARSFFCTRRLEGGSSSMPTSRITENAAFDPQAVTALAAAYDDACVVLHVVDRADPRATGGDGGAARSAQERKHPRLFRIRSRLLMTGGLPASARFPLGAARSGRSPDAKQNPGPSCMSATQQLKRERSLPASCGRAKGDYPNISNTWLRTRVGALMRGGGCGGRLSRRHMGRAVMKELGSHA